ncbi:hypothetical protein DTL42_19355 [Bremerella cremea]|uniref:NrS-1 polymerase-like helicase domain-containing protein n=1 Tax=Bremerella cremea TaxID=1031537 RepID=A0A368KME2_9BACT|nr:primase-helicase family protein [Bremerella cremea]RCS42297.1 hypothetical protein DTL42_19355 [Bremerella cremea]
MKNPPQTLGEVVQKFSHIEVTEDISLDTPVSVEDGRIYCIAYPGDCWRRSQERFFAPVSVDLHCASIVERLKQTSTGNAYQGDVEAIESTIRRLGYSFDIEAVLRSRKLELFECKHRIFVRCRRHEDDGKLAWSSPHPEKHWEKFVCPVPYQPPLTISTSTLEDIVRVVEFGEKSVPMVKTTRPSGDHWSYQTTGNATRVLMHALHCRRTDAESLYGGLITRPWEAVCQPFGPEYPGGRKWNLNAINWAFDLERCEDWKAECEYWHAVLSHIGADLEPHCREHGFENGCNYVFFLLASIVQQPFEPTPYLFLSGPENSGKSTLHEGFELLVNRGVVKADRALTSQSDFNGEVADALLCVVEETDVARVRGAYNKIKELVTARRISIRKMRTDSYMVDNMTHWIQCANESHACPMFASSTRIQPIYVPRPQQDVPKQQLMKHLKQEGPKFAYALANATLPKQNGRLALPIIDTPTRQRLIDINRPEWVTAIPYLLEDNDEWTGTANDFEKEMIEKHLTHELPRTMRKIKSGLASNSDFLGAHFIDFEIHKHGNHAQRLTLRRTI